MYVACASLKSVKVRTENHRTGEIRSFHHPGMNMCELTEISTQRLTCVLNYRKMVEVKVKVKLQFLAPSAGISKR